MARKLPYNHTRFDGGMTHNKRDTSDLTKLGLISHLDIYRNKNEMFVMPGFVADNAFGGSSSGLKPYNVQAFGQAGSTTDRIFALAKTLDGTGSKIFTRILTDTEWTIPASPFLPLATEGTADLIDYPFFWWNGQADFNYPVKVSSNTTVARHGANAADYEPSWQSWITSIHPTGRTYSVRGFDNVTYLTKGRGASGISSITSSAVSVNAKTTGITPTHIATGNYQIGIIGTSNQPRRSNTLLWDSQSLLADQNISIGKGNAAVVGNPSTIWSTVSIGAATDLESNGRGDMVVRVIQGESQDTLYKLETISALDINTDIFALNDLYRDSMLWYAKPEIDTDVFEEGIWAVGKGEINGQFGVSKLLDTSSLGQVRNASLFGESMYFIHNEDGSVSRLDNYNTGTFDVPATIETLIYGSETPYLKELNGISVLTENLPSGGSVQCFYKTDEESAWVEMGVSNTAGAQKHSFTKAQGEVIGRFQEIQFKLVFTGKISIKNLMVMLTETDDLPY